MRARGYLAALPHVVKQQVEEFSFRSYVADGLRVLAMGRVYKDDIPRWIEMIQQKPQDNRTADEIVMDIITRAGLKVQGRGGETE